MKKKHGKLVAWAALLSIPAVVIGAGLTGDELFITNWGLFGSSWTGNSVVNVAVGDGSSWDSSADNTLVVGSNLTAHDDNSLVVGTYNLDTGSGSGEIFVVSNGTASPGQNVFEVLADGTVRVREEQGDIAMGDFSD